MKKSRSYVLGVRVNQLPDGGSVLRVRALLFLIPGVFILIEIVLIIDSDFDDVSDRIHGKSLL